MVRLPRAIVWDYDEPPADERWRLQRLADFFPQYGRDVQSVTALLRFRDELDIPAEVHELIGLYASSWGISDGAP